MTQESTTLLTLHVYIRHLQLLTKTVNFPFFKLGLDNLYKILTKPTAAISDTFIHFFQTLKCLIDLSCPHI